MTRIVYKIHNNYSLFQIIHLIFLKLITLLFFPHQRLIRLPITIRGKNMIQFGKKLTTGKYCRLEAFISDGDKSVKIRLGNNIQINDFVHISALTNITIGNDVLIASNVYISDNSHGLYSTDSRDKQPFIPPILRPYYSKEVNIKDKVWIGEGVIIMPGVNIGEGSIIGAHSVVNKDIPAYCIAVGSPAKIIKRFNFEKNVWDKVL
ncbi:MAG: acetyltransferase [Muribaculaceae bacterium]|nr:acetyltransferase [Muribaculaceae bacterium]